MSSPRSSLGKSSLLVSYTSTKYLHFNLFFGVEGNLAGPKHCFSKPEYTKATDEREPTTQTENEDSKESVPERNEKSDEDVDGPAAGTDSSKNDGYWTFVEDEIPQTRAESNPEERTESKSYQANSPLTAENSRGFQVEDPPSGLGKVI